MIYPEKVPYLTLFTQRVMLPLGKPIGYGNMIYLFTNSIADSIRVINNRDTLFHTNAYKYYFYTMKYNGKIQSKVFHINDKKTRDSVYDRIQKETDLLPIRYADLKNSNGRNCYFELSRYLEIFRNLSLNLPTKVKMRLFWGYFGGIMRDTSGEGYQKLILIDASQYEGVFSGKLHEKLQNPLFLLYYTMLKEPSLLGSIDSDIFIYFGKKCIRINPKEISASGTQASKIATTYKQLLIRLLPHKSKEITISTDFKEIEKEEQLEVVAGKVKEEFKFVGQQSQQDVVTDISETIPSEDEKELASEIDKKVDMVIKTLDDPEDVKSAADKVSEELEKDEDFILKIDSIPSPIRTTVKSRVSSARDAKIREEQEKIRVGDRTIADIQKSAATHAPITKRDVSSAMKTTNPNMKVSSFSNFDKDYNEKVLPSDMVKVFTSLNDKSIPMTIIKYDVQDTSDELNYKDTYTVTLEDAYRQRHTIKVDIPKFIDNRFMWIGGSKKIILCQDFLLPVVKSGPNKVQIVTNTNKMFIERIGSSSTSSMERINKLLASSERASKMFSPGYVERLNENYITTVEYDEFSKKFSMFSCNGTEIYFNQEEALQNAEDYGVSIGENEIFIGFRKKKPILIDQDTQRTESGETIIDVIANSFPEDIRVEFEKIKIPKKLMYSEATTMEQPVALCMLLGFWKGLSYLINAMHLEYRLESKNPKSLTSSEVSIEFKDCTLVYKEDVSNSLIMNGFRKINTKNWNLADFDTPEPYIPYFIKVYGKANIANPLMANYEFNIDPITREILVDMNLPTNMVDLCIYANSLLADSQYTPDYNQKLCRVRTNEIIPAILYDAIAKQYVQFKNSNGKKKLTIPRNIVIKNLLSLKTVEDHSTLNPILELERKHTILYKGWRGINSDHTYTQDKRVYDDSMVGIIGPTTSPDGSVGVQKVLTLEPNISSLRGYTVVPEDKSKLKDVNLFSPAEMLCPLAVTNDDPTRTGHMVKQSKHMLPVKKSSPALISNGADEFVRFDLSSAFVINAKADGEVVEYDEGSNIVICKYKDGSFQAINLNSTIEKNGGGGFYLANHLVTNLKVGDKFKKNDMLAYHKDFFRSNKYSGNRMTAGTFAKIALMSTYNTYQDSTVITEKLSEDMATEMVFPKRIVIGKNSNLDFLIEQGATVDVGDTLVKFDTSFEDNELNELLNRLSEDLKEGVLEGSKNDIKSKYAGTVETIKVYSTVDLNELSPSLKKVVKKYYKKVSDTKSLLSKYDPDGSIVKCGVLIDEPDHTIDPNKFGVIKGENVEDSVLIEIYIKHEEYLETASKVTYYAGLKCTVGEIIPKGYEPWSEFREDEEVSSFIAANSVLKRMTPSIILTSLGNKCIVELKRSLKTLFDLHKQDVNTMKSEMTSLIYKFFTTIDKTGTNTERYKALFEPMSPQSFKTWFKGFFEDEEAFLILEVVDYIHTVTLKDVEKAAKVLNIPLYEYVYTPHLTMDLSKVVRTPEKVPVGYIHIKRPQQTVAKKNGISTSSDIRSLLTNQVTGGDKNGRESDLENSMLVALGMEHTLRELNGPRADDMVMKREMLSDIATKGYAEYSSLTNDVGNKTTLNTVDTFFIGMGLKTDLVTKGYMVKKTLKEDL